MPSPVSAPRRRLACGAVVMSLLAGGLVAASAGSAPGPAEGPAASLAIVTAQDAVRLRKPAPIVLSAPKSVAAGAKIRFVGDVVVKARKPRRVEVSEFRAGRWRQVGKSTSKRNGTFSVRISAGTVGGTRVFRAEAPAVRGLGRLRTRTLKVKVAKTVTTMMGPVIPGGDGYDAAEGLPSGYAAPGSTSDWSYLFNTKPGSVGSRWDPCTVITWTYNPSGASYNALADVRRAFAKISGVSGLRFKYLGGTSYRYVGDNDALDDMPEKMVVGWANKNQFPDLGPDQYGGDAVGIGGGAAQFVSGADVDLQMIQGYLTLDNDPSIALARGFNGSGWGQVMTHEILHALGLGHASHNNQLMYGTASSLNYQFGAGDITGMQKVGAPAGCLS